jgi:NAD(P)-dependent dehydrogenase (short-subunit alcohol dehydrogenase family)
MSKVIIVTGAGRGLGTDIAHEALKAEPDPGSA